MKRILLPCMLTIFLLSVAMPALAAVVSEKSGYLTGSNSYQFEYRTEDLSPTVVKDVLQNDQIVIQYGVGPTKLPLKLEILMKNRFGDEWQFDLRREGGNRERDSIVKGGLFDLDLQGDGSVELVMEFTALDVKKGTFTFFKPDRVPGAEEPETGAENVSGPEASANDTEEAPIPSDNATEETPEPAPAGNTSNTTNDTESGTVTPVARGSVLPVIIIGLIIIVLVVLGAWLVGQRSMPKQHDKKDEVRKEELIEEKVKEVLEESPTKHQMITRGPRKRR